MPTLAVLTREVKTRRESVEAYRGGGRDDLADGRGGGHRDRLGLPARRRSPMMSSRR